MITICIDSRVVLQVDTFRRTAVGPCNSDRASCVATGMEDRINLGLAIGPCTLVTPNARRFLIEALDPSEERGRNAYVTAIGIGATEACPSDE